MKYEKEKLRNQSYSPLQKKIKYLGISLPQETRNLNASQEATIRTGHGTTDGFQIGKGVRQGCILPLCLFNLYAGYILRTLDWMKHKLESELLGKISITSYMQMTSPYGRK